LIAVLNTRLILVEGSPASGKTTTAGKLAENIARAGLDCRRLSNCQHNWTDLPT